MRKKRQHTTNLPKANLLEHDRVPLIEHLHELRRRLVIVAVSIAAGSTLAYATEQHLIRILLRPSNGQKFIYTSPLGGINFIFSVCIYVGIALAIPVIVYQLLRFLQPMMRDTTARFIMLGSLASGIVAVAGLAFGYFLGLPAALHFLLHQFTGSTQIQALLTIQSYLSFVTAYMFGSALMFQLPLVLLFINRIKPLKPSKLFHYERHIIVFAFIAAFIMNPTPSLIDQMLVVIPLILMYQVGIAFIWFINRGDHSESFHALLNKDVERRAARTQQATQLTPLLAAEASSELERPRKWLDLSDDATGTTASQSSEPSNARTTATSTVVAGRVRPRQYDTPSSPLASQVAQVQSGYQQINVRLAE